MNDMADKLYRIWYEKDVTHYPSGGKTIGSQGVAFKGKADIKDVRKMVLDFFRLNPTTEVCYIQRHSDDGIHMSDSFWYDVDECRKRGKHVYIGSVRCVKTPTKADPLNCTFKFVPDYRILYDGRKAELGPKSLSPVQEIDKAWAGGKKMVGLR